MSSLDRNAINFSDFKELLGCFGLKDHDITLQNYFFGTGGSSSDSGGTSGESDSDDEANNLLPPENSESDEKKKKQGEKFYLLLKELNFMYEALKKDKDDNDNENFSTYNLINYTNLLLSRRKDNDTEKFAEQLFSATIRSMNLWSDRADQSTIWTYLAFNTVGFVVAFIALINPASQASAILANSWLGHSTSAGWNHWDESATLFSVPRQWQQGQKRIASVNSMSALMLMACTVLADLGVGLIAEPVIEMSAAAVYGLLGYGFALATIIPAGVEFYLAKQNQKDITSLTQKIKDLKDEMRNDPTKNHAQQIRSLEKTRRFIEIERDHHYRSAKVWAACAIGMTAIAVVGFIALSGVSFGAVPAFMLASVGIALAAGIVRKWYLESQKEADLKKEEKPAEVVFDKHAFDRNRRELNILHDQAADNTNNVNNSLNKNVSTDYYDNCEKYLKAVIPDTEEDTKRVALSIVEYFKAADKELDDFALSNLQFDAQLFQDVCRDLKSCLRDVVESVNYYNKAWVERFGKSMIQEVICPSLAKILKKNENDDDVENQFIFEKLDKSVSNDRKLMLSFHQTEMKNDFSCFIQSRPDSLPSFTQQKENLKDMSLQKLSENFADPKENIKNLERSINKVLEPPKQQASHDKIVQTPTKVQPSN